MVMIYSAITPDDKESEIGKVKVTATEEITPEELATMQKFQPDFQPKTEMYRLEVIDQELADLQKQVDDLTAKIIEKQAIRAEVKAAAATVRLIGG